MNIGWFNLVLVIASIVLGLAFAYVLINLIDIGTERFVYAFVTLAAFVVTAVISYRYPTTPSDVMCFGSTANYKSFGVISEEDWKKLQENSDTNTEQVSEETETQSVLMATYIGREESNTYTCYWGLSDSNLLITNDKELYEDAESDSYEEPVICFIEDAKVIIGDTVCTDYTITEK